jgi:hypothetical protein
MALSFAFDPSKGESFADTEQKRKDARMLIAAALGHTPQNVGEGLSAIGQALIARQMNQEASAAEKTNAGINSTLLSNIFGGAGAFPAAPGASAQPTAASAPTDYPSQRVAQAFAASGDTPSIPQGYFDAIRSAESGGSDTAKNPLSSATGRYQFTKGTWDGLMTTHPELGLTPAGRLDPAQQEKAIRVFTAQNANQLQQAGIPVNGGDLYAAHFLGADGAKNVLTQQDASPVSAYVDPQVIAANPFLKGMSVGQFKQWAASKGGGAAPALPPAQNIPDMPIAGQPAAPQPVQVAQAANTGTPGTMSDADALSLLGAAPYKPGLNNMQAIAAALGSPAASPMTQKIAAALLEQQMKANSPDAQLDMQYKRAQLDNLLHPPVKPTSDMQEYEFAKSQGFTGSLQDWLLSQKKAGAMVINNNPESGMFAGLPKDVRDEMFKRQGAAQDAADLINVTNQGLQLLDQGAITGAGSGAKVAAIKWAQTLGVPVDGDIVAAANNTETYRSIMAKAVGKVIKNFGSGTGLSDADRQYAERLAGGDTNLNEPAIRRILAAGTKQAQERITNFSTMRDKVLKGDLGALLNVDEPPPYTPPPSSGTTSGGLKWSIEP